MTSFSNNDLIRRLVFSLFVGAASMSQARADIAVEAHAGKHDRVNAIASFVLPAELAEAPRISIEPVDGDKSVPIRSQITRSEGKATLTWIIPGELKADSSRSFTVTSVAPAKGGHSYVLSEKSDDHLTITVNKNLVLKYNMVTNQPPQGANKLFARSGYIHPVMTPGGRLITNDFPEKHLHHHGIWFPWTETTFEGKKTDFWNSAKGEGTVEFVKLEDHASGDVFASFRVQQKHVALKTVKGKKDVLNESWEVRVYGNEKFHIFDLTSTQTCAGESPLMLKTYHYGGLGVRGSADWEGEDDACKFLTSEGLTRANGHATTAKWCAVSGIIKEADGGKPAGIAILGHPSNFRFPQKMRIHPSEPFFNFAPSQDGDFEIVPGKPYVSRYRFVVFDGETDGKLCEKLWADFAEPVEVKVVK